MEPTTHEVLRAAWQLSECALPYDEYRSRVMGIAVLYALGRVGGATDRELVLARLAEERARIDVQFATLRAQERAVGL